MKSIPGLYWNNLSYQLLSLIFFTALIHSTQCTFTYLGCFPKSSVSSLNYNNDYLYQSSSYCQSKCNSNQIAALIGGEKCYCGDSVPDLSQLVDKSSCNVNCTGYPFEQCGGANYYSVYENDDDESISSSLQPSTSSSTTTSITSSTLSSSTSTSTIMPGSSSLSNILFGSTSTTPISTTSISSSLAFTSESADPSQSVLSSSSSTSSISLSSSSTSLSAQIPVVTITTEESGQTTLITVTQTPSDTPSSSLLSLPSVSTTADSDSKSAEASSKKISTGTIIGLATGLSSGAIVTLIISLIIFRKWRNSRDSERGSTSFTGSPKSEMKFKGLYHHGYPGSISDSYLSGSTANTINIAGAHNTHKNDSGNDTFDSSGRRRLSDGSLPDELDKVNYHGSLRIVN